MSDPWLWGYITAGLLGVFSVAFALIYLGVGYLIKETTVEF